MEMEKARQALAQILADNAIKEDHPDFCKLWDCFKQHANIPFACADDTLLFETSLWSFGGVSHLLCTMTRQFTLEKDGEYDHMEQLQIDLFYPPTALANVPTESIWSNECGCLPLFWETVERSAAFQALQNGPAPTKWNWCLDEL